MLAKSSFCLIPARGGSKRAPGKNLANVAGKPMLAYTIEAARDSGVFEEIFVSSEDEAILEAAEKYGVTALKRPNELAGDHVVIIPICLHALEHLKSQGKEYKTFAMLQPTSPLRSADDVRIAHELLTEKDADALVTVTPFLQPIQRAVSIESSFVRPYFSAKEFERNEQDYSKLYSAHGAICMAKCSVFLEKKSFLLENTIPYVLPTERAIDVNDPLELKWVEFILSQK